MLRSVEELDVLYQKLLKVSGSSENVVYRLLGHIQMLEKDLNVKTSIFDMYGGDNATKN